MQVWDLVKIRTRDNLFNMRHGEFEVLLEYSNEENKLPIEHPNSTSEKKSQLNQAGD